MLKPHKGVRRLVHDFSFILPSLDTPKLAESKLARTRDFTRKLLCFYFQCSLEQVATFVNNYFKS